MRSSPPEKIRIFTACTDDRNPWMGVRFIDLRGKSRLSFR
jgi:hypothetical protein